MSKHLPEPERWADRQTSERAVETTIGAAFRRVAQVTEPTDAEVAKVARCAREPQRRASVVAFGWRVAFAAVVLLSMGGAVAAALHFRVRLPVVESPTPTPPQELARPRVRHVAEVSPPALAEPLVVPPPTAEALPPTAPHSVRRAAPAMSRPSALPPAPPDEADVLGGVFKDLRSSGDPAAALRGLDDYERRFPEGALRSEARIARAEALLALDRRGEALPLLDGLSATDGALTRNVRLTRAELRVEADRCVEATRDFDIVLAAADADAAGARALYGRASCRLRARDISAARADLERYLSVDPDGALASAARRALESLR